MDRKEPLEVIADTLKNQKEIKQNPFSKLSNEAINEALKLLYEVSEEIDPN